MPVPTAFDQRVATASAKWRQFDRDIITGALSADATAFDALPIPAGPEHDALRRAVVFASIRMSGAEDIADRWASQGVSRLLVLPQIMGLPLVLLFPQGYAPLPATAMYAVGSLIGMALFVGVMAPFNKRTPNMWVARLLLILVVGIPVWSIILSAANWIDPGTPWSPSPLLLGWDTAMTGVFIVEVWVWAWTAKGMQRSLARCKPYDRLLVRTVSVAATLHKQRHQWRTQAIASAWSENLEALARSAAQSLSLGRRPGARSLALRRELQAEALRIAQVFRSYRKHVITAAAPEDVAPVVDMLVCAMRALADGDRSALLADAPELPTVSMSWWRRAAVRVWPSLVLFAAAAVLPMIPAIAAHAAAVSNVRWTLIVTGVVAFAQSNPAVQSRVDSVLDKTLWK